MVIVPGMPKRGTATVADPPDPLSTDNLTSLTGPIAPKQPVVLGQPSNIELIALSTRPLSFVDTQFSPICQWP